MIKLSAKQIAPVINRARTEPPPLDGVVGDLRRATLDVVATRLGVVFANLAAKATPVEVFDLDEFLKDCGVKK